MSGDLLCKMSTWSFCVNVPGVLVKNVASLIGAGSMYVCGIKLTHIFSQSEINESISDKSSLSKTCPITPHCLVFER